MESVRQLVILYGSQTGTAEDCAERVAVESRRRRYRDVQVYACDDWPLEDLLVRQSDIALLLFIATTGQGDHPDNMKTFFRHLLNKKLQPTDLGELRFAICGLGDSSYQQFNFSAKKVYRRLIQLGAQEIIAPVWADEQHDFGVDGLIDPWIEAFWQKTRDSLTYDPDLPPLPETRPKPRFIVTDSRDAGSVEAPTMESLVDVKPAPQPFIDALRLRDSSYTPVRVISQERVTPENHFQDVRFLRVLCSHHFEAGDVAMIMAENSPDQVSEFLSLFPQLDSDHQVVLSDGAVIVPAHLRNITVSLRELATKYLDLSFVPKRSFFNVYKHFCVSNHASTDNNMGQSSALFVDKLDEFSRASGQPDLVDYTIRPRRTVLEVLQDFHAVTQNLQLEDILTLIPAIRPRYYSIANSRVAYPHELQILYAVVEYETTIKKARKGLCSNYLKNLQEGDYISLRLQKGKFRLPPSLLSPRKTVAPAHAASLIFVGPGTGVAPLRAFIQQLTFGGVNSFAGGDAYTSSARFSCIVDSIQDLGHLPILLFFGCRNSKCDYYFSEEWKRLEVRGILRVFTAFSRDQPDKIYVQHKIREQKELLQGLLEKGDVNVFICGNAAQMAGDVLKAFEDVWGHEVVRKMQNCKMIQIETWG